MIIFKKILNYKYVYLLLVFLLATFLFSCGGNDNTEGNNLKNQDEIEDVESEEVFEIREKFFINQINDIFFSIEEYEDKVVGLEGMYSVFTTEDGNSSTPVVYRNGPGCCDNDTWAGFLLNYDGDVKPKENDWIRVEGIPEVVVDGVYQELYLNVTKMEILETRGAEYVTH